MKYDVIVVGCGVAGMTAAIYLKRSGLSCMILEGKMPGGQVVENDKIENYPGFVSISGSDLALSILKQVKEQGIPICYEMVEEVTKDKKVRTAKKEYQANYIILATGRKPRMLGLESEEKYRNKGISYCAVCDGSLYKKKDVVVVGGGDSALEMVLYLSPLVKHLTLLHRRDTYRAKDTTIEKIKNLKNVSFVTGEVKEFTGEDQLNGILLKDGKKLSCEGAFLGIGQIPNTSFLSSLGILDEEGYIKVDKDYETAINGIYAIGDCLKKEYYQIVIAMGEAASCALTIRRCFDE